MFRSRKETNQSQEQPRYPRDAKKRPENLLSSFRS